MAHKDERTGIIEGYGGSKSFSREQIPEPADVYVYLPSYAVLLSKGGDKIYIDVTDYHPGYLCFTKEALERLLVQLKKQP